LTSFPESLPPSFLAVPLHFIVFFKQLPERLIRQATARRTFSLAFSCFQPSYPVLVPQYLAPYPPCTQKCPFPFTFFIVLFLSKPALLRRWTFMGSLRVRVLPPRVPDDHPHLPPTPPPPPPQEFLIPPSAPPKQKPLRFLTSARSRPWPSPRRCRFLILTLRIAFFHSFSMHFPSSLFITFLFFPIPQTCPNFPTFRFA